MPAGPRLYCYTIFLGDVMLFLIIIKGTSFNTFVSLSFLIFVLSLLRQCLCVVVLGWACPYESRSATLPRFLAQAGTWPIVTWCLPQNAAFTLLVFLHSQGTEGQPFAPETGRRQLLPPCCALCPWPGKAPRRPYRAVQAFSWANRDNCPDKEKMWLRRARGLGWLSSRKNAGGWILRVTRLA